MAVETFASRVRGAGQELGNWDRLFTVMDLVDRMGIQSRADKRMLYQTIRDFVRYGEWARVGKGEYRLAGVRTKQPQKQHVMWRFLRMQRTVTVEDLQEIAGASEDYAKEWLGMLVDRGAVRDHGNGKFQLIQDTLQMPANDEKAERLRALRQRKRDAMKQAAEHAHHALNSLMAAIELDGEIETNSGEEAVNEG